MAYQSVFKRYELKYLVTNEERARIVDAASQYMALDRYGRTTIRNIYLDTDNYRLIRRSIEKPEYKEKLRIRSYKRARPDSKVFVELKKKYKHVVYKRRIAMSELEARDWVCGGGYHPGDSQISREIDYFLSYYGALKPSVFLSYEREAYYMTDGGSFRVTFDDNILCRDSDISLEADIYGQPLLRDGMSLMELKCDGGIPMWMARTLSEEKIYKTSFSKYGMAYETLIYPKLNKEKICNA